MTKHRLPALALASLTLAACDVPDEGTSTELRAAVDESVAHGQAATVEEDIVALTTDLPVGLPIPADPAAHVRGLVESQIPCSTVTEGDDGSLVIDFGALDDGCEFRGRAWGGVVTVRFDEDGEDLVVAHEYDGVTDGRVTIDGDAIVTRTLLPDGGVQRHIVSSFALSGPRGDFRSESDRVQTLPEPGAQVFAGEGSRWWQGPRGEGDATWDATIDREFPVPIDGEALVHTPKGHELQLSFQLVDDDTVQVTVDGQRGQRVFEVQRGGAMDERGRPGR